jgi:serine/threonine protein kinase
MGTPDYVAPEQISGAATVDVRADLYSLGATLFHLLAGRAPFADRGGLWPKLDAHRQAPPPDLRRLRPEVPAGLAELVARLLAKKPEDRPQTPAEVAAALTAFTTAPTPTPPVENGWRGGLLLAAGCAALAAILVGVIGSYYGLPWQAANGNHPTADAKADNEKPPPTAGEKTDNGKPPTGGKKLAKDRVKPKVGDRVTLVAKETGFEDEDPEQRKFPRSVPQGTEGEVVKIDKERDDLCQIRLVKPAGVEVWVPIEKLKVTDE